jgi:hypothetical protein
VPITFASPLTHVSPLPAGLLQSRRLVRSAPRLLRFFRIGMLSRTMGAKPAKSLSVLFPVLPNFVPDALVFGIADMFLRRGNLQAQRDSCTKCIRLLAC